MAFICLLKLWLHGNIFFFGAIDLKIRERKLFTEIELNAALKNNSKIYI